MRTQRQAQSRNNGETTTFTFQLDRNPKNSKVMISIDVSGTGSKTTTGKAIKGRMHPDAPWVTLASPSNSTAATLNTLTTVCPEYQVTMVNGGGSGVVQTHSVAVCN